MVASRKQESGRKSLPSCPCIPLFFELIQQGPPQITKWPKVAPKLLTVPEAGFFFSLTPPGLEQRLPSVFFLSVGALDCHCKDFSLQTHPVYVIVHLRRTVFHLGSKEMCAP